eukprot:276340_1
MASRARNRSKYYNKLITNITKTGITGCSFDINVYDEYFNFQRSPFYHRVNIDFYQFIIGAALSKYFQPKTNSNESNNYNRKQQSNRIENAITVLKHKLYRLSVNHPTFGSMKTIKYEMRKNGNMYITFGISLYDNKLNKKLICYIEGIGVLITKKRSKSLQKHRNKKQQNKNVLTIENFPFVNKPSYVGKHNKKEVLLSDLRYDSKNNNLYALGFIDISNGFDSHPYLTGTGDHINAAHISELCLQFIYLLVRNCKKIKDINFEFDNEFIETIDVNSHLVLYESDIKFKKFVELGQFKLKVLKLEVVKDDKFIAMMKIPYAFKVWIYVEQHDQICADTEFSVCPIYLSSSL